MVEVGPIERQPSCQVRVGQHREGPSALQGFVVRTGVRRHRQPEPEDAVVTARRDRLERRAVGGQEEHDDAIEADHLARRADERGEAIVPLPGALHRDGGMGEPLEQRASLLRRPQQPRLLDGERGLVRQRRQQRDLIRQELARSLGEDIERADGAPVSSERDTEVPEETGLERTALVGRIVAGVRRQILDHDGLAGRDDMPTQALADLEPRP